MTDIWSLEAADSARKAGGAAGSVFRRGRWAVAAAIVCAVLLAALVLRPSSDQEIAYPDFRMLVQTELVQSVEITPDRITGILRDGSPFETTVPQAYDGLLADLEQHGVAYRGGPAEEPSAWLYTRIAMLPFLGLLAIAAAMLLRAFRRGA